MRPFWQQASAVAGRDLRTEVRSGEVLLVTTPFGAVALLVVPLAVGTDAALLSRIGPGVYWVVVLLFGMLVALRQSAADAPPQRDLTGLLGIDAAARFTGQAVATFALLLAFEVILGPVAIALYSPTLRGWWWLILIVPLFAMSLALLGTLAGWITVGLEGSAALVPLLVAPLGIPVTLAATQALEGLQLGESILGWMLLLVALDLILAVAGVLSARPLEETAR